MPTPCWLWLGACDREGYGQFNKYGKSHRISYRMAHADPGRKHVLHECDNPSCVRPEHLRLGTDVDNHAGMMARGRTSSGERHAATRRGERNGRSKFTADDVIALRAAHAGGESACRIAIRLGVCKQSILAIVNRKHWTHI